MNEQIEKLIKQREDLSDKIMELHGTSYTQTRNAILENIKSLDEVLKEHLRRVKIKWRQSQKFKPVPNANTNGNHEKKNLDNVLIVKDKLNT